MISTVRLLALLPIFTLVFFLTSCSKNSDFYSEHNDLKGAEASRASLAYKSWNLDKKENDYLKLLKKYLAEDKSYSWNSLSSSVIVRALPYSPTVAGAAEFMYGDSPYFYNEVGHWGRNSAFNPGAPLIVILGVYAPDLSEKDLTHLKRFRPLIKTNEGKLVEAVEMKRYGWGSTFISDHFPNFNHWEHVYMLKFQSPGRNWQSGVVDFYLEWPGGTQHLKLKYE